MGYKKLSKTFITGVNLHQPHDSKSKTKKFFNIIDNFPQ